MLKLLRVVSTSLLVCLSLSGPALAGDSERAKELFREGANLFRQGMQAEALAKFQEALQEEPDQATASEIVREADRNLLIDLMNAGGEFETLAGQLLEIARLRPAEKRNDPAAIEALVRQLRSDSFATRRKAIYQLSTQFGEYAVGALAEHLDSNADREFRYTAMSALSDMGGDAVMPLAACLRSSDTVMRRSAATVLGRIGDRRALPFLKALAETETDAPTAEIVQQALRTFGGASSASAHDLACELGETLLQPETEIGSGGGALWRWDEKRGLVGIPLPPQFRRGEAAREAFALAIERNPESTRASSGLVRTYQTELAAREEAKGAGEADWIAVAENLGALAELGLAASGARSPEGEAVAAVETRETPVATQIAEAFAKAAAPGSPEFAEKLGETLRSPDKKMRYAAAITLAASFAPGSGAQAPLDLVPTLANAVGEEPVRVVQVVDEKAERRARLIEQVAKEGYHTVAAEDGAAGLIQIKRYGAADLVLISSTLSDIAAEQLLSELANDERTSSIPVFVVADAKAVESTKERFGDRAKQVVDGAAALDLAQIAEAVASRENEERKTAEGLAQEAAWALASLDSATADLSPASASLLRAVQKRGDEIAVPAAQALAKAGHAGQVEALAAIFADATRSTELRAAVAEALGGIFSRMGVAPTSAVRALAAAIQSEADATLRRAAAAAIGRATRLTPTDRVFLFTETLRILPPRPETPAAEEGKAEM